MLWRKVREGCRVPEQGPRRTARLIWLPCRALEAPTHDKPDREHVRDRSASNGSIKGLPLEQDRARHDLQARASRREKLASSPRSRPVAESCPRCKVQRRNRGRQIASSSRCRLTSLVTKIRRYLLGLALLAFGRPVQDIRGFVHPAALCPCLRPRLVDRLPEAECPIGDGELWVDCQTAPLEIE